MHVLHKSLHNLYFADFLLQKNWIKSMKTIQTVLLFILDSLKMFGKLPVSFHNIRYINIFRISFFRCYQITKVYHYMHLKLLYLILLPLLKNKISSTSCRNMISLISIYYCEQCSIQNFNGNTFLQYIAILLKIY